MKDTTTLIKDKELFISYAKDHTIPQIAEYFGFTEKYVKNYVGNHKITYKKLDMWHGMSNHRLYHIYRGMVERCYNKNHIHYKDYGGRGITICKEWLDDKKVFFNWALDNGYSDNLQIDRIDCNGRYEPTNCRFVTSLVNQNNRRVTFTINKVPLGMIVADEECNPLKLSEKLVWKRVTGDAGRLRKWTIEEALATPVTNVRGSHKILPIDKNTLIIIQKGLGKIFSKYETT